MPEIERQRDEIQSNDDEHRPERGRPRPTGAVEIVTDTEAEGEDDANRQRGPDEEEGVAWPVVARGPLDLFLRKICEVHPAVMEGTW